MASNHRATFPQDFGGQLNTSYQFGANLVSFRGAGTAGLFEDGFTDYGPLYGRATHAALYGFANLNRTQPFAGLTLSVQAGQLR